MCCVHTRSFIQDEDDDSYSCSEAVRIQTICTVKKTNLRDLLNAFYDLAYEMHFSK